MRGVFPRAGRMHFFFSRALSVVLYVLGDAYVSAASWPRLSDSE